MIKLESDNNSLEELRELTTQGEIIKIKAAKQLVESGKHLAILQKALADDTSTSFTIPAITSEMTYDWNEFNLEPSACDLTYCGCDKYCNEISWEDVQEYFKWTMLDKCLTFVISSGKPLRAQYKHVMDTIAVVDWEDSVELSKHILKRIEKRNNGKVLTANANYVYVPDVQMLAAEANRMSKSTKKDIFGFDEKMLLINAMDIKGVAKWHRAHITYYGQRIEYALDVYTNKIVFEFCDKDEKKDFEEFIKYCLENKKTIKDVFNTLRNQTLAKKAKEQQSPNTREANGLPKVALDTSNVESADDMIKLLARENNNIVVIQNVLNGQLRTCAQQTLVGIASKTLPDYAIKVLGMYCTKHTNITVVLNNFNIDLNKIILGIDADSINMMRFNDCTLFNYDKLRKSTLTVSESNCIHSK